MFGERGGQVISQGATAVVLTLRALRKSKPSPSCGRSIYDSRTGTAHRPAWIVQAQTAVDRNFQLVVYSRGTFVARPRKSSSRDARDISCCVRTRLFVCLDGWIPAHDRDRDWRKKKKHFRENVTSFVLAALSVTSGRGYLLHLFLSSIHHKPKKSRQTGSSL